MLEIIVLFIFIGVNCFFIYKSLDNLSPSRCQFKVKEVPELDIKEAGVAHMQCEVKKVGFFLGLTSLGVLAQFMILLCSVGSLIWYGAFRSVSKILGTLKTSKFSNEVDGYDGSKDFWFLLDLIAHSSGMVNYQLSTKTKFF